MLHLNNGCLCMGRLWCPAGPAILFSLFWKRMTRHGCIAGIIVGGLTVLIWKQFGFLGLYEIVPGFIFSSIAIYVVSIMGKLPPRPVL